MAPVSWRRNQTAVVAASFMGFTGFTLVMPFLPLYIRQLGVDDIGEIAMWSGLSLGVTPAVTAILSPFWGRIADRYGRKLLVQRSLLSFAMTMAVMAGVSRPWHIFALRAFQGLFAGYGGLTMAMAAESAPREKVTRALGLVQTAQRIGPTLGPVIGGAVAGLVGLRQAFFVTSGFYLVALVTVSILYRDPRRPAAGPEAAEQPRPRARALLAAPGFVPMLAAIFVLTFVDRSVGPILPLWIEARGVEPGRVAIAAGIVFSASAFGAALGHTLCEAFLRRRGAVRVVALAAAGGVPAVAAVIVAPPTLGLALTMGVFGMTTGVAATAAYTEGSRHVPAEAHGEGFGFLNGASLAGLALSPPAAGLLSQGALVWVFVIDVGLLAALALVLRRPPRRPPLLPE